MKRLISCAVSAVLFFALPVRAWAAEYLVPVGKVVGLQLRSGSVTVVAYDENLGAVAREAGLKIGDEILSVENKLVSSAEDVRSALETCEGPVHLTVRREGNEKKLTLEAKPTEDGPRLGIYLRQGIAGIGTVTFYDPETGLFGTLGHGVCDGKGNILEMTDGSAYDASVASVRKGRAGDPGQLKGNAGSEIGATLGHSRELFMGLFNAPHLTGEAVKTAVYSACLLEKLGFEPLMFYLKCLCGPPGHFG